MQAFMHSRQQAYLRIASLRLMIAIATLAGIVLLRIVVQKPAGSFQSTIEKTASPRGAADRLPPLTASPIVLIDL